MTKTSQEKNFNFIDLFSGAGGLSCGMEMAGWNCLLGVDANIHAIETFRLNHKNAKGHCGDIANLTIDKIKELTGNKKINAVVGGPPCQGFSTIGVGNPNDKRNSLFLEFVRIVQETSPEFIVIENVTGLLAKKNEKTLNEIITKFNQLGYELGFQVMSSDLYGVPERRRRTIIIGSKINQTIEFPLPTHNCKIEDKSVPAVTVGEALNKLITNSSCKNHDLKSARITKPLDLARIKRIPEGKGIRYKQDEEAYLCEETKMGVNWDELDENRFRQTRYQRLDRKKVAPTIMTNKNSYFHPTENRYLTAREAATLQSFPLDFEFVGKSGSQWKQIGNAVPPLLGKAIGEALLAMKSSSKTEKQPTKAEAKEQHQDKISEIRGGAFRYGQNN